MGRKKKEPSPIKATLKVEIPAEKFEAFVNWVFGVKPKATDFLDAVFNAMAAFDRAIEEMDVVARKKDGVLVVTEDADFDDENGEYDRAKVEKEAIKRWKAGEPLPDGFYAIDRKVCLRAYLEGIKLYGLDWQESDRCDNYTYDTVFQRSLFGERRWG